jgi:hypothetical protein
MCKMIDEHVDAQGMSHGFLLDRGIFTMIHAPEWHEFLVSSAIGSARAGLAAWRP